MLDLQLPPTALFVGNNLMTLGALEAIRSRALRIPSDVALVGYDDVPWASAFSPPLTTVQQPAFEIGRQSVDLLIHRIRNPHAASQDMVLQPRLIVRGSCGASGDDGQGC